MDQPQDVILLHRNSHQENDKFETNTFSCV